jgi:hypothetical protein
MKTEIVSKKVPVSCLIAVFCILLPARVHATWTAVVSGTEFTNTTTFLNYYSYNYTWGQDQNGSARMESSNVVVSNGTVTLHSYETNSQEPAPNPPDSADSPYLPIRYYSGTFHLNHQITVATTSPMWDISIQAKVPTATGTWPAFWMTGADSWPPESDFMEFKGVDGCSQNTYDGSWQGLTTTVSTAGSAWHSYRMVANLLNSTEVDFHYYIDGIMESEQTSTTFVGAPCTLMVDYQMEGSSGSPGPNNPANFVVSNLVVKYENTSSAGSGAIANGAYKFVVRSGTATTNVLDVGNNYTTNGSPLDQWPYNAGLNQQWIITYVGSGQYSIIGRESGRALEVRNAATTNGALVDIADYTAASNQHWKFIAASGGAYYCLNAGSGLALGVAGNASTNLAPINQWTRVVNEVPAFTSALPDATGSNVVLTATVGIPGQTYNVLSTTDPTQPLASWTSTATVTTDANGNISYTNPINTNSPQQFFALQLGATAGYNQQWLLQSP